jgi:hypothetical protein
MVEGSEVTGALAMLLAMSGANGMFCQAADIGERLCDRDLVALAS